MMENDKKLELLPCPFCGKIPRLENSGIKEGKSRENGDLITKWKVFCVNCGVEVDGGISEYVFMSDETIRVKDAHFDGRKQAIDNWNRRA